MIAGVDEAGRGPLAGPVVAAAVILCDGGIAGLDDSKKLSAKRRAELETHILARCIVGIGMASVEEIDRINILQATFLAMTRAVEALPQAPAHVLVDGKPQTLAVDSIIICAGQDSERSLADALQAKGVAHSVIGGAEVAAELDALRAIDEGMRCALAL